MAAASCCRCGRCLQDNAAPFAAFPGREHYVLSLAAGEAAMMRTISHSEVSMALDCWAKHAFAYTGVMTGGDALKAKRIVPQLRDGRAWGAAVAAFHQHGSGHAALGRSLAEDAAEQREQGVYNEQEHMAAVGRLTRMLDHYAGCLETRIPLVAVEHEMEVPLPSRGGRRASNRYHLHCFLDGVHRDPEGRHWIVEFKLRKRLSSESQIALSRQTRWYAWAWEKQTGTAPAGVIVDERLNAEPSPVALNRDETPSKRQSCTPDAYLLACRHAGVEHDVEVYEALRSKEWQKRTTFLLRPAELMEAGWQLTTAANLIQQLDTGRLYPIRNPSPARCPGCQFFEICDTPEDRPLVDSLYTRVVPKRDRDLISQEAA